MTIPLQLGAILEGRDQERERCAKLAEQIGKELGEPAIGWHIAKAIRSGQEQMKDQQNGP